MEAVYTDVVSLSLTGGGNCLLPAVDASRVCNPPARIGHGDPGIGTYDGYLLPGPRPLSCLLSVNIHPR